MTNNRVNFTERHIAGGWAKYLPAISGFYTTHLGKDLTDENFVPASRLPAKFEFGLQGLNFLDPEYSYFNYKFALYSAGHAERNLTKCNDREPMIHKRDRTETIIIGDSGGFQIATGVIKLDWSKVMTTEGDKLREEILRYLEYTADWSMTLDVPAFAALPPLSEKTGLTKFEDCLDVTEHNLKYFMKNRVPGATKFLNVISGSDNQNSKTWYDRVKKYSTPSDVVDMGYTKDRTFEGWAFAGTNMQNMTTTLERMLDMRRDGLLENKDWIHFLGIGRLDWACFLTSIERQLKKYDNPNISISFDAASPFVAAGGYALSYNYNKFSPNQLTYAMGRGIDDKGLKGKTLAMPFQGPIMERLTTADMCVLGPNDLNKHGKEGKTSWDTTTYALVMAHNVYNHIQAIQEINRLADIDYATRKDVDFRDWYQNQNKNTKQNHKSKFVPNTIIYFNHFVEELFDPANKDPYNMLKEYGAFLDYISFGKTKRVTVFNDLFGEMPNNDDDEDIDVDEIHGEDLAGAYNMEDPPEDLEDE
jgi:hypothetical protein